MTAVIARPAKKKKTAEPLKVVIVTHYYGGHGGGIEMVADRLVRELAASGAFQFVWAASDNDPPPLMDGLAALPLRAWNFLEKTFGIPWPVFSPTSLWRLRKAVRNADVLWLHDTLFLGNLLAYRVARRARKPIMITQHLAPIPYRNPLLRWAMRCADTLFTARMLRAAHEVIFISDRVAEDYYRRVAFTRAIKVIPNGVDIRLFHAPIPENRRFLREQFALKKDQPVFLFVGRFVEKKGMEVLRRLAEKLPSCRFWLAGDGPIRPEYWLLPNVHVFKDRKNESLAELYHASDLFLMPSYGEGFPLVIQEAMACGLPVMCGAATAHGCRSALPFLHIADVWPKDPEKTAALWAERILSFPVSLPLKRMIDKNADFALKSWDWPPIAQVYAEILVALRRKK